MDTPSTVSHTLVSSALEVYCCAHSEQEPELLRRLSRDIELKGLNAKMSSGHLQGRILSLISTLVRPKTILEIGTYAGYSALCLAEGLQKDGKLYTIDKSESLKSLSKPYFDESPFRTQIVPYTGNAIEVIKTLSMTFDLVFIDADKKNYTHYFDLIIEKMNSGGCIISDNVLWRGKVVENSTTDEITKNLMAYNRKLSTDPRVRSVILPIRDGITISRVN